MKIGIARRGFSATGGAEHYLSRLGRALAQDHALTLYCSTAWPASFWPGEKTIMLPGSTPRRFARSLESRRSADETLFSFERVYACDCFRAGDGVHLAWLEHRASFEPRWRSALRAINGKHREILQLEAALLGAQGAYLVIANSHLVKNEIVRFFDYPADRIQVIYNGLPESFFSPRAQNRRELRRALGWDDRAVYVLFAGSGWFRKGLRFALAAFQELKSRNLQLVVAGTGAPPPQSKARFLGPVKDIAAIYGAADLFILPTIYDPFSNACLEALSFGLPVITTASNGCSEIITAGIHGEIVQRADDVAGLVQALAKWADPERRAAARSPCVELAKRFRLDLNLQSTLQVLGRQLPR